VGSGTFREGVEQLAAVVAAEGDEVVGGVVLAGEGFGSQEVFGDLGGLQAVEVSDAAWREAYVC
jgi:hypothetical protein